MGLCTNCCLYLLSFLALLLYLQSFFLSILLISFHFSFFLLPSFSLSVRSKKIERVHMMATPILPHHSASPLPLVSLSLALSHSFFLFRLPKLVNCLCFVLTSKLLLTFFCTLPAVPGHGKISVCLLLHVHCDAVVCSQVRTLAVVVNVVLSSHVVSRCLTSCLQLKGRRL